MAGAAPGAPCVRKWERAGGGGGGGGGVIEAGNAVRFFLRLSLFQLAGYTASKEITPSCMLIEFSSSYILANYHNSESLCKTSLDSLI